MEHLHSALRYLIVVFVLASVVISFVKWRGGKPFTKGDKITYMLAMVLCHIQLVIGLILYVTKKYYNVFSDMSTAMKVPVIRFYGIEHVSMMILAIIVITIGYSGAKKLAEDASKHKRIFFTYLIGFDLIFLAIPWPFLRSFGDWF